MQAEVFLVGSEAKAEPLRAALGARGLRLSAQALTQTLEGAAGFPAIVILHLATPEQAATIFEIGAEIRRRWDRSRLLLVAEAGSEALAVRALREGFHDYVNGWRVGDILAGVDRLLGPRAAVEPSTPETMIGGSQAMRELRDRIFRVARTSCNVLITGETGTGKEIAAQMIHAASVRGKGPMVCVNCASVPDTLIESELFGYERGAFTGAVRSYAGKLRAGHGGTVFFDEIGDMPLGAQAKLLRLLEEHVVEPLGSNRGVRVDMRVISATNRDLERLAAEERFRRDLYFRLNVVQLRLSPLRERAEDVPLLVEHFRPILNRELDRSVGRIDEEAMSLLQRFEWPGNVRELKNVLQSAFVETSGATVTVSDLPSTLRCPGATSRVSLECERLLHVLRETKWNKSKAAEKMRWSRMTLYRKMAKYHIASTGPEHPVTGSDS
jgi:DNA-binding NtrC family response regulator